MNTDCTETVTLAVAICSITVHNLFGHVCAPKFAGYRDKVSEASKPW